MNFEVQTLDTPDSHHDILELALREKWSDRKQHALNWNYHLATETRKLETCSVLCLQNGQPVALALAVSIDTEIQYFGSGINISYAPDLKDIDQVTNLILDAFVNFGETKKYNSIHIRTEPQATISIPELEVRLLNLGANAEPLYFGIIDLRAEEADIKSDIRKSYKSLINFGKREIRLEVETGENANKDNFEAFRKFHIKTAGRETRPIESWEEMFKLVKGGQADIAYGYYEDKLVSCSYLPHYAGTTLYGSGVYERELFDKPISHWPIYNAILYAKARGDQFFDLGEVYFNNEVSEKERNIAYFKKGFTSRVENWKSWKLKL